eukprot:TRINITY_DN10446_c0_g1_i1.p1 TRINITY_DN10446_c0_g1~~TRINITY_DN10446_c0_g1_i1.p1  ORF type:complete len:104 (+),score=5.73 TRINITY_DN10446_c0_g1_i1:196-507(+)
MFSMTPISVAVVSEPTKEAQSLTTIPAPITDDPLFTVPVITGTCNNELSSFCSSLVHFGWTKAPLFETAQYDPTNDCPATDCRNTSTSKTSATISSVDLSISG